MNKESRIFIAGHKGLVGSAILRRMQAQRYSNILVANRKELDLTNQSLVNAYFAKNKPDVVFLAAAKVGGILANSIYPADFFRDNIQIQTNVIDSAYRNSCQKLIFLGSSCIYPKLANQPMSESELLTGPLEPTNQSYAIAKIAGVEMCQAYRLQYGFDAISIMPTNLYGPGDNFDLKNSHVLPALIRKFHDAVQSDEERVEIWGSGKPRREFLHVDDLATACEFLAKNYSSEHTINVGTGVDISIAEVARLIAKISGFGGILTYDNSKPDGTPRKLLDVKRLTNLGWTASISLEEGIQRTYDWYSTQAQTT